jgi:hypothetical protein
MSYASFIKCAPLAVAAILAFGCNKNHDEARVNAPAVIETPAVTSIADFSSLDAKSWENGTPISLTESRGKHVVLIEVWHPS